MDHTRLYRELSQFAAALTRVTDVDVALHQLSVSTAGALHRDGAGVTLSIPGGSTQYIVASDPITLDVERRQNELHEGACIDAIARSEVVAVDDIRRTDSWPRYTPAVLGAGFHSVAGVPIHFRGSVIGAMNLYGRSSRPWSADEVAAGQMIADVAAGYLVHAQLLHGANTLTEQLQHALESRVIIEQAKGVLAERHRITADAAFDRLRRHARSSRDRLRDVAAAVVAGTVDPLPPHGDGTPASDSAAHPAPGSAPTPSADAGETAHPQGLPPPATDA